MNIHHAPFRKTLILFILLFYLSGCTLAEDPSSAIPKTRLRDPFPTELPAPPYFIETDCRFDLPPGKVICGDLFVLENREDSESPLVSLHVAIFPSYSVEPRSDPVIYLMGGGGGDSLAAAGFYLGAVGGTIRAERDFILYNQRGVKRNDPYLACPGEGDFQKQLTGVVHTKPEADLMEYDFLIGCRDYLRDQGVNLDFYDSVTHAADLADLIKVLGYDQANIYGTSYGTRLGLTVMRHHPELIRSAILDAVLPPQVNFPSDAITSFVVSVENLFAACAAQDTCQEKYPDLEDDFYRTVEELKDETALIDVDGEDVVLDHILFLDAVYMLLHASSDLPYIPRAIHNASLGEYSWLINPIKSILGYSDFVATGVQYSSMCKDEVNFDSLENSQALLAQYHQAWGDYFELSFYYDTCRDWIIEPADEIENTPVVSDIPSLVMAGHFDSITSPAWCEETAGYLENSFYYEFPNMAHGTVRYDDCALGIALDFIADPWSEPDSSCMAELGHPDFK